MGVVLDSSEIIHAERGRSDLYAYLEERATTTFVAAITISEIMVGALLADTTARRDARLQFLEDLLSFVSVIPFAETEARIHAELRVALRLTGEPIGAVDMMIAATAIANGHTKCSPATFVNFNACRGWWFVTLGG